MESTDAVAVREGDELDWAALERYLREHMDVAGEMSVLQFPHGSANLTYLVTFGTERYVLRRPPFGTIAPGAHDMQRESRVLMGLGPVWDKAPRCHVFCDDHSVVGADFVVMEHLSGIVIRETGIPPEMAGHPDVGRRVSLALADATAELHILDPDACGLGDLGRPDGFVARQVSGWWRRWQAVADPACDAAMASVHAQLERTIPTPPRVSFVHGDIKLNNCLFDPTRPDEVKALFDWDMTTLGDPLLDLGMLLNYWPAPGPIGQGSAAMLPELQDIGAPSREEMAERYGARSGIDVSDIGWYIGFSAWKTAVIVQQLYHRYQQGQSSDHRLEGMGPQVKLMADTAVEVLDGR